MASDESDGVDQMHAKIVADAKSEVADTKSKVAGTKSEVADTKII